MSYLAHEISELLRANNMTGAALSFRTGLVTAQISRWRNAEQISIKPACLNQLASGFPDPIVAHARLLFATLKDACVGPGEAHISLKLKMNHRLSEDIALIKYKVAPKVQSHLEIIAKHSHNRKIRALIHAVASLCHNDELTNTNIPAKAANFLNSDNHDFKPAALPQTKNDPTSPQIESFIRSSEARRRLGLGVSYMSAIKRRMGLRGRRYVLLSNIQKWMLTHPEFQEREIYHRSNCNCSVCVAKRSNPNRRIHWRTRLKEVPKCEP